MSKGCIFDIKALPLQKNIKNDTWTYLFATECNLYSGIL